ncbi:hypothetical protein BDV29DRAFT_167809 [Aspergillus leporis]|uniref:Uncharacterized protein n=1 Tax=Aspergillus leporis TaxID=41062 RepID=A0A5N5XAM9_9EURO|nr:hypothetical protein BDV29DRAFT_167809 [Aspergillus leporis]
MAVLGSRASKTGSCGLLVRQLIHHTAPMFDILGVGRAYSILRADVCRAVCLFGGVYITSGLRMIFHYLVRFRQIILSPRAAPWSGREKKENMETQGNLADSFDHLFQSASSPCAVSAVENRLFLTTSLYYHYQAPILLCRVHCTDRMAIMMRREPRNAVTLALSHENNSEDR